MTAWFSLTGEARAEAKARDEENRTTRQAQLEQAKWTRCATLNHSVGLYFRKVGSRREYSYRGTNSKVHHTWTSEATKRAAFLLSQSDWQHLPPRIKVSVPPVGFLELRRGRQTSLCLSDRAFSLFVAVDLIREQEQQ